MYLRSIGVHQRLAVGLLFIAELDHEDFAIQAELGTSKCQGGSPLAGAGFGHDFLRAFHHVVVSLGQSRVGLVRPAWTHPFVLVVNLGRSVQVFFQIVGPKDWSGAVFEVFLSDELRDFNVPLGAHFLGNERLRKEGPQHLWTYGLSGARMQRRQWGIGHVRNDVVEVGGKLALVEGDFGGTHDAGGKNWGYEK